MNIYNVAMEQLQKSSILQRSNEVSSSFNSVYEKAEDKYRADEGSKLDSIFRRAAQVYSVPEDLLKAVAYCESGFKASAVSPAGAMGIMQLMPNTAKGLGVNNPMNPEENIMGGAKLLSGLMKKYGNNIDLALAGYNAGTGNVAKYGGVPPFKETENYIKKIKSRLNDSSLQNLPKQVDSTRVEDRLVDRPYFTKSELYYEIFQIMARQIQLQSLVQANSIFNSSADNISDKGWL